MTTTAATAGLLLSATLIAGCGAQSVAPGTPATSPAMTAAARPSVRSYRFDEKSAFITDMSAELALITREFDLLFPTVGAAGSQVQSEVVPAIETLRALSGSLYRHLDEARTATAAGWPALTAGFTQDLGRLNDGLEQSRQKLSAPSVQ